jgi:hypothetical protein
MILLQESQAEIWDTEQFSRKQHFVVLAQTQRTHVQRLSAENKEVSPYIPLQAGYRSKKQSSTIYSCMWLYWLFYFPSAMWPSLCFSSLNFIPLLCHSFPLLHYQNTSLFLFWSSSLLQYNYHSHLWFKNNLLIMVCGKNSKEYSRYYICQPSHK